MDSLISVIIPVYNVEDYLERCVHSVIFQSHSNLDIILVNDGSTDRSGFICESLANRFRRITVIHKENGGLSSARNEGLKVAKGNIITFLDSDDYIHKDMYQILINQMELYSADISECAYRRSWGFIADTDKENAILPIVSDSKTALKKNYNWSCFHSSVWNKLYTRAVIGDVRFPVGKIHEDEFFIYKVIERAKLLVHVDMELLYYQQRTNSIIGQGKTMRSLHAVEAFKERVTHDKEKHPDLYESGCKRLIKTIYDALDSLVLYDNRSARVRKPVMKAFIKELSLVDGNALRNYGSSKKHTLSIRLLRVNKAAFRWFYTVNRKMARFMKS